MSKTDPNDGQHLERIINTEPCEKHKAFKTEPCWIIESAHGLLRGICNNRALAAGAQGKVTPYIKYMKPKEHV